MLGLSGMLTYYGIDNAGIKMGDKESDVLSLNLPFIAHTENNFIIVYMIADNRAGYICNEKEMSLPLRDFIEIWDGTALLTRVDEGSAEPDYEKHKKLEVLNYGQEVLFVAALLVVAGMAYINNLFYASWGISLLLIINLISINTKV